MAMNRKVYPIGYSRHGNLVEQLMQDENILLIDTRKSPNSKIKGWSKDELQEKFGEQYRFAGEYLGNVNAWNGGPIKLVNPRVGIHGLVKYLDEGHDIIILCGCADYDTCHRRVVVDLLKDKIPNIEILFPESHVESGTISCLSIRQPYASWICNPGNFIDAQLKPKTIENRDWNTDYRGRILINASKTFEKDALPFWFNRYPELRDVVPTEEDQYPLGCLVGEAMLTKVITVQDTEAKNPWFSGKYGFVLANAKSIDPPIPCRGQLKIFDVDEDLLQKEGK